MKPNEEQLLFRYQLKNLFVNYSDKEIAELTGLKIRDVRKKRRLHSYIVQLSPKIAKKLGVDN